VAGQEPDAGATGMVHDVAVRHRVRAADVPGDGGDADGPPGVPAGQTVGGAHPESVPRLRGQARVAGRPGPAGGRPGGADPRGRRDQAGPATPVAGHRRPAPLRAAETSGGGRSAPIPRERDGADATGSVPVAQAQRVGGAAAVPGQPGRETRPRPVRATQVRGRRSAGGRPRPLVPRAAVAGAEGRADWPPPAVDPVRRHDQASADAAAGRRRPAAVFRAAARRHRGAAEISGQSGRATSPSGVLERPRRGDPAAGPGQGTSGARPVARRETGFTSATGPVGGGQRHGQEVPAPLPARHRRTFPVLAPQAGRGHGADSVQGRGRGETRPRAVPPSETVCDRVAETVQTP